MKKLKISGLIGIVLMSIISAFVFAVPKTTAVATYTYVVTNWGDAGCSGSLDYVPSNLLSPGDRVTILGTGFGNRSVSDNVLEMLYLTVNGAPKMIYRAPQNFDGQTVYTGLHSWTNSSIDIEVEEGRGGTLGLRLISREYNPGNQVYSCYGGTLAIACDSSTYSDWGACQPNGTQTRTVTTSFPNGCSVANPVLSQNCVYTPPTCTSLTYSDWGACQPDSTQTRTIINSSPGGCSAVNPILSRSCTLPTIYTATNFQTISCPYGADITAGNVSSSDNVRIVGTGFENRNIADGIPESIYLPSTTPGKVYSIQRELRDEGGPVYYGPMSWNDSEINTQVASSTANSLGSYIILRKYSSVNDNTGTCVRGTLTAGLICGSFTYSDWGTCSNGQQTRSVTSSSPNSCTGGTPILTQSCTPVCTLNDYSCNNWDNCSADGVQIRTCTKNSDCEGGVSMPSNSQSCTYTPPTCTSWTYSDWGTCSANGQQARTIVSALPAGCAAGNPTLSKSCTYVPPPVCTADTWLCADWSSCSADSLQTRTCTKTLDCPTIDTPSSAISRSCTYVPPAPKNVPVITSISPDIIEKGTNVTLRGSKFMNLTPNTYSCINCKVLINGSEVSGISAYSWFDDHISFLLPSSTISGYIQVQDSKGNISEKFNFTIQTFANQNPVSITSVSPTTVAPGELITILGSGFGSGTDWVNYLSTLIIGDVNVSDIESWNDTEIKVYFPLNSKFGQKVRIKRCKNSWSTGDDCALAVSNEIISEKKYSDDQLSGLQWYLENINAPQAWQITQGSNNVVVAVIDSGVDTNHEDLTHSIWLNQDEIENNRIDDDHNGYVDDRKGWNFADNTHEMTVYHDHGTAVAGVIAAKKNNILGIAGIAPNIKIMPLTVLDSEGGGSSDSIIKAIKYAVDNGANIINLSLGGLGLTFDYLPVYDKIVRYAYDHNVLIIAAAGNGDVLGQAAGGTRGQNLDINPESPVCNDDNNNLVIGVGATTENNLRTTWSNYGACVDVWAPGEGIVSTSPPPNDYYIYNGTSFSTPVVSAVAALIKSLHPDWNVEEIKTVLINSQTNFIIDAYKAVTANKPNVQYRPRVNTEVNVINLPNQSFTVNPDIGKVEKPIVEDIPFPDIEESKYQEAINTLKQKGFVKGNPDGTFKPFNTLNRAEFMTILMHNLPDKIPEAPKTGCGFSDIKASDWFAKSICFAKSKGYAKGYPNGAFKPGNSVNFVEALALTERIFGWQISEDKKEWFRPFVIYAEAKNVIPESINSFGQKITREEMAELIVRFIKNQEGSLDSYLGTKSPSSKITYVCLKNGTCNANARIEVIFASVRIRNGIGYNAAILETATLGQRFEIINEKDGWYQVKRISGGTGWIEGKWVKKI